MAIPDVFTARQLLHLRRCRGAAFEDAGLLTAGGATTMIPRKVTCAPVRIANCGQDLIADRVLWVDKSGSLW